MTEAEWLTATDPGPMLAFLRGKASDRKLRLFACACCRRIWHLLPDGPPRQAVACAEESADGRLDAGRLQAAHTAVIAAREHNRAVRVTPDEALFAAFVVSVPGWFVRPEYAVGMAASTAVKYWARAGRGAPRPLARRERAAQCALLRDLFGNPFRPVAFDPRWRTDDVVGLARAIYEDRAFDRLPLLADALMDAGCEDEDVLVHCRSAGQHVRGCWVVDLALGKS